MAVLRSVSVTLILYDIAVHHLVEIFMMSIIEGFRLDDEACPAWYDAKEDGYLCVRPIGRVPLV